MRQVGTPWWTPAVRRWLLVGLLVLTGAIVRAPLPTLAGPPGSWWPLPPSDPVPLPAGGAPGQPQLTGPITLIAPTRVLDTRSCCGGPTGFDGTSGAAITATPLQANTSRRFLVNGKTFPQGSGTFTFPGTYGVLANVTIVSTSGIGGGFVTVFPGAVADANRPNASTVNPSTPIAHNSATVAIEPTGAPPSIGTLAIYTTNTLDVVVDVYGYFTAPLPTAWSLAGNAIGVSLTEPFLGTTDAHPLIVSTNNSERLRVAADGRVGVGTQSPTGQLEVHSEQHGAVVGSTNAAGGQGVYGGAFGLNGVGVFGIAGGSNGVGVSGSSTTGLAMQAAGPVKQDRTSGGWVKAMVRMTGGTLVHCFNGQATTAAAADSCAGFTVTQDIFTAGAWTVKFPFQVNDRFISITAESQSTTPRCCLVQYYFSAPDAVVLFTWDDTGSTIARAFALIVY